MEYKEDSTTLQTNLPISTTVLLSVYLLSLIFHILKFWP